MRRATLIGFAALVCASAAGANNWERFYQIIPTGDSHNISYNGAPEKQPSLGSMEKDYEAMWRKGFEPIGYSGFNSPNGSVDDALAWAKKIGARYVIVNTTLVSSQTTNTYFSFYRRFNFFSGFIPVQHNRFDKWATYWREVRKEGLGIRANYPTNEEMAKIGSRRAVSIAFVRDGSPADVSNLIPGDLITEVEGAPFNKDALAAAVARGRSFNIRVYRHGSFLNMPIMIPAGWAGLEKDSGPVPAPVQLAPAPEVKPPLKVPATSPRRNEIVRGVRCITC